MRRSRGWTCRRQQHGIVCRQWNPGVKQKCVRCGAPRPKRTPAKHRVALEASYDYYVEITGGERCAICLRERKQTELRAGERRLHRDHDHRTGRPRGLLCFRCNSKLPYDVTPEWLRAAADYLERSAAP